MEYGRIENQNLKRYQTIQYDNGGITYNPTHEQWIENDYYPIIENKPNERDGFFISENYNLINKEIIIEYIFNVREVI